MIRANTDICHCRKAVEALWIVRILDRESQEEIRRYSWMRREVAADLAQRYNAAPVSNAVDGVEIVACAEPCTENAQTTPQTAGLCIFLANDD